MNGKEYEREIQEIIDRIEGLALKVSKDKDSLIVRVLFDCKLVGGIAITELHMGGLGKKPNPKDVAEELLKRTLESRTEG